MYQITGDYFLLPYGSKRLHAGNSILLFIFFVLPAAPCMACLPNLAFVKLVQQITLALKLTTFRITMLYILLSDLINIEAKAFRVL